jgi:general secretion pathway protein K
VGETGETRRFNAEQRVLLRLLLAIEEAELSRSEATRLVERITDFVDPDRNPRIEGAEDERYLSSAFPYRAPNRPLASVSELRAVDEFTPELYRLIAPFLTVWPSEGSKVNLLTAPPEVLAALNEDDALEPLSAQQVARIIELRDEGMLNEVDTFIEDVMFSDGATGELRDLVDVKSSWFLLDARVEIADRERRLYSVLHRQGRAISVVHRTEGEL